MVLRVALLVPLLTLGVILQAGLHVVVPSHHDLQTTGHLAHPALLQQQQQLLLEKQLREQTKEQHPNDPFNPLSDVAYSPTDYYKIIHEPKKEVPSNHSTTTTTTATPVQYHLVFSTACSQSQDWQSYLFFYHVYTSGQPGNVTRIVSGCRTAHEEASMREWFRTTIQEPMKGQDRFHIHFTPDYGQYLKPQVRPYKYFNKPLGTLHWMEHALGYSYTTLQTQTVKYAAATNTKNPATREKQTATIHTTMAKENPQHDDTIVILLDPDQIILEPFVNNDFSHDGWKFLGAKESPQTAIRHGAPMGQMYGFSLQWKKQVNTSQLLGPLVDLDGPSPVDQLTHNQAQKSYIVGPPYIATARDFYAIARQWSEFVPRVHDQYPHLLAEMFAYCLAAAHLQLPHQTARTFMVSSIDAKFSEGWYLVETLATMPNHTSTNTTNTERNKKTNLLGETGTQGNRATAVSTATMNPHLAAICSNSFPNYTPEQRAELILPRVFHYCQRYNWGPYFFGKYKMPSNILSCKAPRLANPPVNVANQFTASWLVTDTRTNRSSTDPTYNVRQAFSVCTLIHALNNAQRHYKLHHCQDPQNKTNWNKKLVFVKRDVGYFQSPDYVFYSELTENQKGAKQKGP